VLTRVAYFSLELALSEALPIYSGGLGNVAGESEGPPGARQPQGVDLWINTPRRP